MKAQSIEVLPQDNLRTISFTLTVDRDFQNLKELNKLTGIIEKGKELKVEIKQYRNRRSLDANAYCFVLCQKIAEKIGNTKEYVYQEAIKQVGTFEIVPIRKDVADTWVRNWKSKGLGWHSEIIEESKLKGYVNTINYYGSSTYNTQEFSKLLEEVVYQAKELGIETMTPEEQAGLIAMYETI